MKDNVVAVDRSVMPNRLVFAPRFNVAAPFIDRHLDEGRGEKTAIVTADETVTYGELARRVSQCGNALLRLGLRPGDRLLMVVRDSPGFIAIFFGAIKAGIVPVAVNTLLRTQDYSFLIDDSECAALLWSEAFAATVKPGLDAARHRPGQAMTAEAFLDRAAAASDRLEPAPATALADCFWLYSSGSTGNPKGVVHPHRSMVCTSERFAHRTAGLRESDTVFSVSKLFHSYGFGNAMTFPLWVGATIVLSDRRVSPDMTFETIERFRPSVFFGVPTLYAQQLHALDAARPDLSSIRLCISAGEALPGEVLRRWMERTGTFILDGLGSTENLHIFIANRADDWRANTSGKPVSGYHVKLVDEDGREIAEPEKIGTVWVRGESAARCYWKNPEKTAKTMRGEWLNTGDMYWRDADGYWHNAGRGDDMLKVGALWCSPFEIEARLIEHPKVLEAAVVGRPDEDGLTKPEAYVVLKNPKDASPALERALVEHCRAGLAHYKYPRWFHFVADLPKTATGKIQRFRLRE